MVFPHFLQGKEGRIVVEIKKKKETPKIDIFKAWCKACGICVAFCPTGVLAKDEAGVETKTKGKKKVEVERAEEEPKPKEEEISPERIVASGQ